MLSVRQPPAVQHWLLHAGDEEFPIRADRDAKMRALPLESIRLGTGGVGEPERSAIVVRDGETEALRRKEQASHRRRCLEAAFFAFLGVHMRDFARRPRDRTIRTECNLIDPTLLVIGSEQATFDARNSFDELAIVAAGKDPPSIGSARQNGTAVNRYATLVIPGKQQCLLAKDKDRYRAQKMHANHRRARVNGEHAIG